LRLVAGWVLFFVGCVVVVGVGFVGFVGLLVVVVDVVVVAAVVYFGG
jgi:hypothetical protein